MKDLEIKEMTREEWLNTLTNELRPVFEDLGYPLPDKLRVSCGWPSKGGLPKKNGMATIGQCWYHQTSGDQSTEVFVSPTVDDTAQVAATLVHELCHAANGKPCGHRGEFVKVAKAVGLLGPWSATTASEQLAAALATFYGPLGTYPHARISPQALEATGKEKSGGTRLLKAECAECGYTCRVTKKWLAEKGAPICPCNMQAMLADMPGANAPGDGLGVAA
jgi:SprT-like family